MYQIKILICYLLGMGCIAQKNTPSNPRVQLYIDQFKRTLKLFSCEYKDFEIKMVFDGERLQIKISNSETLSVYELMIDQKYTKEVIRFFEKPIQVFNYLTQNSDNIVVEDGIFKFDLSNQQLWVGIKPITLKTNRIQLNPQKKEELITKRIQKKIQSQLAQKDQQIKRLRSQLEDQRQKNKDLSEMLQTQRTSQQSSFPQQPCFPSTVEEKNCIGNNMGNVNHQLYYKLQNTKNDTVRLTKIDNKWYNFVNKFEIQPAKTAKYSVKIGSLKNGSLLIGFCTSQGFNNESYNHRESAYFNCSAQGSVHVGGQCKQLSHIHTSASGPKNLTESKEGDMIGCEANLIKNVLVWSKNGNQFYQCALPEQMRNKKIYLSIFMFYTGNHVDLSI